MQEQLLLQLVNLVQNVSEDMQWIKQEFQTMKQEISELKTKVNKQDADMRGLKENTAMIKAIRDNQLEQRSIQDALRHEIAHIRGEMATKRDIAYIHERLDYQLGHIARTEEELYMLKKQINDENVVPRCGNDVFYD